MNEERVKYLQETITKRLIEIKEKYSNIKTKEDIQKVLLERRNEELKDKLNWYLRYENQVLKRISNKIDWNNINPYLKTVENEEDLICYEYLRGVVSSAPKQGYVGRQIKFLLIEKNSNNICGLASIGSDLCIIGERDKLIGWTHKQKFEERKLSCGFNINVCISLQPYGQFLFGKLIAMILCSNEIRDLWKEKYRDPCLYVLTTSLYGKSSQYNRIDEYLKYIGETKGFGNIHIDKDLYKFIDEYLTLKGNNVTDKIKKGSNVKMTKISTTTRMISSKLAADKHHNLSRVDRFINVLKDSDKHHQSRGIYLGFFAENSKDFLTCKISEQEIKWFDRPISKIIKFWKERWYNMRLPKLINLEFNPNQYKILDVLGNNFKTDQNQLF